MKDRIEELASKVSGRTFDRYLAIAAMQTVYNESLELAARECNEGLTAYGCAAAIRKLKVR